MIVDYLKNKDLYVNLKIHKILDFISKTKFEEIKEDKVIIDDDNFFMVADIFTKSIEDGFWESHKKYIDIHYILKGSEIVGYENIVNLSIDKPYDEDKDFMTYHGGIKNSIELKEGMFLVVYPEDAHMPNISTGSKNTPLKKVVFKIRF